MASKSIADRWTTVKNGERVQSARYGQGKRWRARYRDEAGKEHAKHFERKVEAQRWLDEVTTSLVTGLYVDPRAGNVTFKRFYDDWSARQVWVTSTRDNADLAVRTTPFEMFPLKSIRRSHVESWVKKLDTRGLKASTIHTRFISVRAVFRAAVAEKYIAQDPCEGVTLPRRDKSDIQVPTASEIGRLCDHADSGRVSTRKGFRAFVELCAFAGLRLGEASGVQVSDIDFGSGQLRISRQIQREGSTFIIRPPKYGSKRTIYLPDRLVKSLAQHVTSFIPEGEPTRWMFPYNDGPLYDNAVTWRWRATRSSASLSHIRLHDLRHFYASGLIAAGCDVVTVQRALGHDKPSTTLDTYGHLWPRAEDRTRAAAADLMLSVVESSADSLRTGDYETA